MDTEETISDAGTDSTVEITLDIPDKEDSDETTVSGYYRSIFEALNNQNAFDYGKTFKADNLLNLFGIDLLSEEESKELGLSFREIIKRHDSDKLAELTITCLIRDELLGHGKYFKKSGDFYRILLASENLEQVEKYRRSATKKVQKADKLLKTTPQTVNETHNQMNSLLYFINKRSHR